MKSTQSHLCILVAHALLAPALLFGALSCNKMNLPGGDKLGGSECRDVGAGENLRRIHAAPL